MILTREIMKAYFKQLVLLSNNSFFLNRNKSQKKMLAYADFVFPNFGQLMCFSIKLDHENKPLSNVFHNPDEFLKFVYNIVLR